MSRSVRTEAAWFDEECLQFLDQTKQAKLQWLNDQTKAM